MSTPGNDLAPVLTIRHGVLLPGVRRDLADLNRQYLELATAPGAESDPRCAWSDAVRQCVRDAGPAVRAAIADAPFALFELALPSGLASRVEDRVADGQPPHGAAAAQERWSSLAYLAAFLAWRLADGAPMAARVVLGLAPAAIAELRGLRLAQVAEVAVQPGLIRARWPCHLRYWQMLAGAVRRDSATALQWAHCAGLCLLGADDAALPRPAVDARQRRPRR